MNFPTSRPLELLYRQSVLLVVILLLNESILSSATAGPMFGSLCPAWMDGWVCNTNLQKYLVETKCPGESLSTQTNTLVDFFMQTGNTLEEGPLVDKGWLSSCDACDWSDVICNDQGIVTGINSTENEPALQGTLPTVLVELASLDTLILYGNEFTGKIPSELALMTRLTNLRLHYNEFTGDMPEEICGMGGFHGVGVNISADCAKPNEEVTCKYYYCCDFCYY